MANVSATIKGHQGTGMGPLLHHWSTKLAEKNIRLHNMHTLKVVAKCTLLDEVSFCVTGLGLCTRNGVQLTSHVHLSN